MIERYESESFVYTEKAEKIKRMIVYYTDDWSFFFEPITGHVLIADRMQFDNIQNHMVSEDFFGKLRNHGFVEGKCVISEYAQCDIKPEFFMIDLTDKCNMRCKYCLRNVDNIGKSISSDVLYKICDYINNYCNQYQISNISIQPWGGEPLLEIEKIINMRKRIKPQITKVHFSIETNGLLLTKENVHLLYDKHIGIGISIDGFDSVHNSQRIFPNDLPTHKIVEKNLLYTKSVFGERLGTITTVTRNNAPYIEEILDYFAQKLKLKNVKFNFVHQSIFFDCKGLCLDENEIASTIVRVLNRIIQLNEQGYFIAEHNINVKLHNLLTAEYTDICHCRGCSGGKKMIVFDMNGNIYPCELTDIQSESFGNISDDKDLIELVKKSSCEKDFFIPKKADVCKNCDWYCFCRGGCTVRGISCGKRPPEIDTIECAVNRALYPALVELILTKPEIVNRMLGYEVLGK